MKIKKSHIFVFICACLLFVTVKMCESEDYMLINHKNKREVEQFKKLQEQSDSLLTEVINGIKKKELDYTLELDSLHNMVQDDELSSDEINRLNKEIVRIERLLEIERSSRDTVVELSRSISVDVSVDTVDSIVYNIIERDTIIYNIIEVDSIIKKLVYEIDTVHYDSDDIKKLKLHKD